MSHYQLGLGLTATSVSAALARDGEIARSGARSLDDMGLDAALDSLLADMDLPRRASIRTVVGLCPPFARFKRLADLPPLASATRVHEALIHSGHLFFPAPRGSLTVGGVWQGADGIWCATAIQTSVLDRLRAGCERSGLILDRAVATPVAIATRLASGSVLFRCDANNLAIDVEDGRPSRITVLGEVVPGTPRLSPPADAEAAALMALSEPLSTPVAGSKSRRRARSATHLVTIASAMGTLVIAGLMTPLWTSTIALERSLAIAVESTTHAESVRDALRRESRVVAPFHSFIQQRVPTSLVLSNLLDALDGDAEVGELVIDSMGAATFQVRSATLPRTIERLSQSPHFKNVRMVGGVSQRMSEDGRQGVATIHLARYR